MLEVILYCMVTTVGIFGALTLLPLWIGLITSHPRKLRLVIVPTVPFVVTACFANVALIVGTWDNGDLLSDFQRQMLFGISSITGFSAFALWIVTWALFKKWRTGN